MWSYDYATVHERVVRECGTGCVCVCVGGGGAGSVTEAFFLSEVIVIVYCYFLCNSIFSQVYIVSFLAVFSSY